MRPYNYILLSLLLISCAAERDNVMSNSFHNMSAHYNAYFIAKERIDEIETSIFNSQDWNYDKILPIHPQFDSTKSASLSKEIEDCIQKSSLAIQRHPGSKWEDDSYFLVGKARYYELEFADAVETFKYINTHSKNSEQRQLALSELIRTFTDFNEMNNGIAVIDYMEKEKLTNKSERQFAINAAYLYQKREDLDKMVKYLTRAEKLTNGSDKARINFIIAQTYQSLNFESEAYRYYKRVLSSRPNYDLEFYSKLYMSQVTQLTKENDLRKIRKYFKGLLDDPKNKEYQDKIYYELAGFELKNNNLDEAIGSYKKSVRVSTSNQRQKSLSYLKLGEIYYDSVKDFRLAQAYYDSTITILPKDEDNYEKIKKRQEILKDFVTQLLVLQRNDSLIAISQLSQDSLQSLAASIVNTKVEKRKAKRAEEKKRERARARNNNFGDEDNVIQVNSESGWYFTNVNNVSKGRNDFLQVWGERPLEDDWRRGDKSSSATNSQQASQETETLQASTSSSEEADEIDEDKEVQRLLSAIPTEDQIQEKLLPEIEEALFKLGNIYNFQLEEDINAIDAFVQLLDRFPETEYEPEVLYQLFLLYKRYNSEKSELSGMQLISKYPETVFAKLVENPNYREESFATSEQLKKLYRKKYSSYKSGFYKEVIFSVDSALKLYPDNEFSDNIALLKVLAIGQSQPDHKYQYELDQFGKDYPQSELVTYASSLKKASEEFQVNRYNSARARYIQSFDQTHFFIITYRLDANVSDKLNETINSYLNETSKKDLKTGNLILNESTGMLILNEFAGKEEALQFLSDFSSTINLKESFKGAEIENFVITQDNFDILYRTKNTTTYITFFNRFYSLKL